MTFLLPQLAPLAGDLGAGDFVGEVLDREDSTPCSAFAPPCTPSITPPTITRSIIALHAIYEVQAGHRSFTALIRGGQTGDTAAALGAGLLNGVILAGWRTGANVQVAFQKTSNCADRDGVTHGPCFEGTIHVDRAPED